MFNINKGLKLKNINIKEYKVLKDFNIDFIDKDNNPLPIIIIAGVNGTGKTTILNTIMSPNFFNKNRQHLGVTKYSLLTSTSETKKYQIQVLFNGKEEVFDRALNSSKKNIDNISTTEEDIKLFEIENFISYLGVDFNGVSHLEPLIVDYIDSLIYEKSIPANEVYENLRKYINQVFSDMNLMIEFDSLNRQKEVFIRNKQGKIFRLDKMSTGEKTLFTKILSLYLSNVKDGVILIDEPELSLHPSWQNKVLELYENFAIENNCQIIIATHSPHILGSAKGEYIRLLTENQGKIEVINNLSNPYGAKFSQILTDIMGVTDLRTPKVNEKFTLIEDMIINNKFDTEEFKTKWQELEDMLGKNYFDLKLLKLEIASRRKNV